MPANTIARELIVRELYDLGVAQRDRSDYRTLAFNADPKASMAVQAAYFQRWEAAKRETEAIVARLYRPS